MLRPRLLFKAAVLISILGGFVLVARRDFRSDGCSVVDLKTLGDFTFDQSNGTQNDIPASLRALDGHHIKVSGYMIAEGRDHLTWFGLVPTSIFSDNGPYYRVQDGIFVRPITEQGIDYCADSVLVRGVLRVRLRKEKGSICSIYELMAYSVKRSGKP